jgi:hypothetical protein
MNCKKNIWIVIHYWPYLFSFEEIVACLDNMFPLSQKEQLQKDIK